MSGRAAIDGGTPVRGEPAIWPPRDEDIRAAMLACFEDGAWGTYHGPYCEQLRERIASQFETRYVALAASGRFGIELALRGLGVKPGDEVILSAYDFNSNFGSILNVGAKPVIADVRESDAQLDVEALQGLIGPQTRAVIASHVHGGVVDMPGLIDIARRTQLEIVEDACQVPGGRLLGRPLGSWGDVGVLSFGGSKLLTAGRGGAVMTARDDVFQRVKLYASPDTDLAPLSELQAAVLLPQLDRLPARTTQRTEAAQFVQQTLAAEFEMRPFEVIPDAEPAYYKIGLTYSRMPFADLPREDFCEAMRAEGFAFSPGFPALHKIHSRRRFRAAEVLPVAEHFAESTVTLYHPILLEPRASLEQISMAAHKIRERKKQAPGTQS